MKNGLNYIAKCRTRRFFIQCSFADFAIITILFLVLATYLQPAAATSQISAETEEYAVYSAVIQTLYIDTGNTELIVIEDQTRVHNSSELSNVLKHVRRKLPDLTEEVSAGFEAQNRQKHSLKAILTISVKYVYISRTELDTIFRNQDGWAKFYARFPKSQGCVTLSRVGFNPQMDMALVYVGKQSDWLAGKGYYVLLKKVNSAWVVQGKTMAWIS